MDENEPLQENSSMSEENNKLLVRRYIDEVWNGGNSVAAADFFAPDYKRYLSPAAPPLTRDGQQRRIAAFQEAFPDIRFEIENLLAEDDRVVFRSTILGTHRGVFRGVAPTGNRVRVSLIDIVRVENGRFAEHWGGPDALDLLQQLGAGLPRGQRGE
jgi:predicted ester cyclase